MQILNIQGLSVSDIIGALLKEESKLWASDFCRRQLGFVTILAGSSIVIVRRGHILSHLDTPHFPRKLEFPVEISNPCMGSSVP